MKNKPYVVQFGAGAIGRGFLGQLWTEGGYPVLFVDVNAPLVDALRAGGSYPLRLTGGAGGREIGPVSACLVSDMETATAALARCVFACSAVGAAQFPALAPLIAQGIVRRARIGVSRRSQSEPLNIVCCENQKNAAQMLQAETEKHLPPGDVRVRDYFEKCVGFVDASVGRMVPPPTPELLREDPLLLLAEPYAELPIDGAAWEGSVPPIPGLLPKNNFAGYVARKLFTHNGGHALLAYEGFLREHDFIWQCIEDVELVSDLRGFWEETGTALCQAFGFDAAEQKAHENDLLTRFANRELGDTVLRVGRDPVRKLREGDRLVGAARLCEANGVVPVYAARAIAAALRFAPRESAGDPSAQTVQNVVKGAGGVQQAMTQFAGAAPDDSLVRRVEAAFSAAQNPANDGGR